MFILGYWNREKYQFITVANPETTQGGEGFNVIKSYQMNFLFFIGLEKMLVKLSGYYPK